MPVCSVVLARDDKGVVLDAQFFVVEDGGGLDLILESAGGASADRPARNTNYRTTLGVLLGRLRRLGAVIDDALVDSRFTQQAGFPAAQRHIRPGVWQATPGSDG